jgi:DNA-binding beta-propeller fold protein YncE
MSRTRSVVKLAFYVCVCLPPFAATGRMCVAQIKIPKQSFGVDNTKMGTYRALAELALQAFQKGDNASAQKLARILERCWDRAEGDGGGDPRALEMINKHLFAQIDDAMDHFVEPLEGYQEKAPDSAKLQAAYDEYLEHLEMGDETDMTSNNVGPSSPTEYHVARRYKIPGEGNWDYIAIDSDARRLYVSHGTQVEVLDADSGKIVGKVADTPGVHGVAIASEFHRGFTSNGRDKSVTIFDTETLATIQKVPLESGTDFIIYDQFSRRVFTISKSITAIDAESGDVVGSFALPGDPEAAVSDGKGALYVNLADKQAIAVIDPRALSVTRTYRIEDCATPRSLSYDDVGRRLFVGCGGQFAAVDASTGKAAGRTLMCSGVDASGFDAQNKLIFESCAEGVISIIKQNGVDSYELIQTLPTQLYARTMAFDAKTKNIYLPTAESETVPGTDAEKSPLRQMKAGSLTVLVVAK